MAKQQGNSDAGREVIRQGLAALKSGDRAAARDWFERAQRLAPDSPHVAVMLASVVMIGDPAEALRLLDAAPASRWSRDARMLRVTALQELELIAQAAEELGALLAGFVIPPAGHFGELAASVAQAAGYRGWAGVAANGKLICSAADYAAELDGQPLAAALGRGPIQLPAGWRQGRILRITVPEGAILPDIINLSILGRIEGAAWVEPGGQVTGWALSPADPELKPQIELVTESGKVVATATAGDAAANGAGDFGVAHGFRLNLPAPEHPELLRLRAPDGRVVGNPIFAWLEAVRGRDALLNGHDPWRPLPAAIAGLVPVRAKVPEVQPTCVLLLTAGFIGDGPGLLRELLDQLDRGDRLVVAGNAREAGLWRNAVAALGQDARVSWATLNTESSLAAAIGLAETLAWKGDLLILSGGVRLMAGGLPGLRRAVYQQPAHGTASPLAYREAEAPAADPALIGVVASRHAAHLLPVPVCNPYCVLIRHDCLASVASALVPLVLPGGGEAIDFTLRATHLGWRHVSTSAAVVIEAALQASTVQQAESKALLELLHPGALALIEEWQARGLWHPAHLALETELWRRLPRIPAVLLITHDSGGGIERFVAERVAALQSEGKRAILLRPRDGFALSDGMGNTHPHLRFDSPGDLVALLRGDHISAIEVHHAIDFDPGVLTLPGLLRVPYDVYLHDYAAVCPRITMLGGGGFFCGEPADRRDCEYCIADHGAQFAFSGTVEEHRARYGPFLRMARRVIAPTKDAANRLLRFVPKLNLVVRPWEDDALLAATRTSSQRKKTGPLTVAIVGGIGKDKGYDVLLSCARDAERRQLDLRFVLIGQSIDDERLLATGRVFVTGYFKEGEAPVLLERYAPDLGFVPSVWPETWCYSLSALLQAGLHVICFDLGGPAERLRDLDRGSVLPLLKSAAEINDHFLKLAAGSSERN